MKQLVYLMLLLPFVIVSQENESFLLNLSEITVKPGHDAQFIEGVKAWKKCYKDNEGTMTWNMWRRVQGEGSVYTLTSTMSKWAEMDDDNDKAGRDCYLNVVNLIMPNVKNVHYNIARSMPEFSRSGTMEGRTLVWVYNVQTNNSSSFLEVVKEITMSTKKAEGDARGTWYNVQGGAPEVADFFVAIPFKNFAEMDVDKDNVWTLYEKANGKTKADALRAKFRAAVSNDWSYMYTLNEELSSN
jgi:hypothetical protein